jgi:Domain of unknown function (DUF4350)
MKLRQFLSIMGVVALVAVIYSPSTIGFSASPGGDGGTGPADTSPSGTSTFLSYLRGTGYHVTVANDSQQLMRSLNRTRGEKAVYLLIGPDLALSGPELQTIKSGYQSGGISVLIAEGNTTNSALLRTFGAEAQGTPIVDPGSPFQDKRVFTVDLTLGSTSATGLIDIASALILNSSSDLHAAGASSNSSYYHTFSCSNNSHCSSFTPLGQATVVGAGSSPSGARAVVLTDSAPFTNFLFNYTQPQVGVDEKGFVAAMVSWVDPGKNATIVFDSSHYVGPAAPKFEVGLPVGPLVAYGIEQSLSGLNGYYASFPSQVSGFLGGFGVHVSDGVATALVALILLISVYGAVARWFAPEKKGNDDLPPPKVERTIVAESRARVDFLQTARSKGSYVATLAQLYDVLDSIVVREFGSGISSVEEGALAAKIGAEDARRAMELFLSLSKFHDYASGKMRFLFPPVLRWRALTSRTTSDAEAFLNRLGITMAGEELQGQRARVEYVMKEKVRA